MKKFITSESVTEGHPDKICDKVSDKILDTALELDKNSKMAVECTIKDNLISLPDLTISNSNKTSSIVVTFLSLTLVIKSPSLMNIILVLLLFLNYLLKMLTFFWNS